MGFPNFYDGSKIKWILFRFPDISCQTKTLWWPTTNWTCATIWTSQCPTTSSTRPTTLTWLAIRSPERVPSKFTVKVCWLGAGEFSDAKMINEGWWLGNNVCLILPVCRCVELDFWNGKLEEPVIVQWVIFWNRLDD